MLIAFQCVFDHVTISQLSRNIFFISYLASCPHCYFQLQQPQHRSNHIITRSTVHSFRLSIVEYHLPIDQLEIMIILHYRSYSVVVPDQTECWMAPCHSVVLGLCAHPSLLIYHFQTLCTSIRLTRKDHCFIIDSVSCIATSTHFRYTFPYSCHASCILVSRYDNNISQLVFRSSFLVQLTSCSRVNAFPRLRRLCPRLIGNVHHPPQSSARRSGLWRLSGVCFAFGFPVSS